MFFAWELIINICELTSLAVTKTHHLAYWKEDSSSGRNTALIIGDRVIQGKRGATNGAGPMVHMVQKELETILARLEELESRG